MGVLNFWRRRSEPEATSSRSGRVSARLRAQPLFGWVPQEVFYLAEKVQVKTGLPVVQIEGSPREIIFSTSGGYKIAQRLDRDAHRPDLRAQRGSTEI